MSKHFRIFVHGIYLKNYSFKKSSSLLFLLSGLFSRAQNNLKIAVKSKGHQQPLPGASVIISQLNKGVTDWGAIYSGSITNPAFTDIYAPLEGRTINDGIKIKL